MFFQFSSPPSARSLTKACSLFWNSFTELAATTSYGSKLYTFISPKADRRSSSGQFVSCTSSSCLWCRFATLRVQYAAVASTFLLKKRLKCCGPSPSTVQCTKPSIAMSLLVQSGAKFHRCKASSSVHPTVRRSLFCSSSSGFKAVSVAWYKAEVRHSRYPRSLLL